MIFPMPSRARPPPEDALVSFWLRGRANTAVSRALLSTSDTAKYFSAAAANRYYMPAMLDY